MKIIILFSFFLSSFAQLFNHQTSFDSLDVGSSIFNKNDIKGPTCGEFFQRIYCAYKVDKSILMIRGGQRNGINLNEQLAIPENADLLGFTSANKNQIGAIMYKQYDDGGRLTNTYLKIFIAEINENTQVISIKDFLPTMYVTWRPTIRPFMVFYYNNHNKWAVYYNPDNYIESIRMDDVIVITTELTTTINTNLKHVAGTYFDVYEVNNIPIVIATGSCQGPYSRDSLLGRDDAPWNNCRVDIIHKPTNQIRTINSVSGFSSYNLGTSVSICNENTIVVGDPGHWTNEISGLGAGKFNL